MPKNLAVLIYAFKKPAQTFTDDGHRGKIRCQPGFLRLQFPISPSVRQSPPLDPSRGPPRPGGIYGSEARRRGRARSFVKPAPFHCVAPRSLDEALAVLGQYGEDAKVLAGGQSLIPVMNLRLARPRVLVDLGRVAGLDHLVDHGEDLEIGVMVTRRRLELWEPVGRNCPARRVRPHVFVQQQPAGPETALDDVANSPRIQLEKMPYCSECESTS